jgi:transposase
MNRYIGIDAHLKSCTVAVMGSTGRRLQEQVLETHGKTLKAFIASLAGEKYVCLEEGELSEWLYELMLPLAKEVVVVQPEQRKVPKSDSIDAWDLAEKLRTRRKTTKVYKAPGAYRGLREAVHAYRTMTADTVREKNRLRAIFRTRGIQGFGKELYAAESREPWLKQLCAARRRRATLYGEQLDALLEMRVRAEAWLREEVSGCKSVQLVATAPGIGLLRASQLVATVITPHRFRTKHPFWNYCGLAVVNVSSSDWERGDKGRLRPKRKNMTRGLNRNRNPVLKDIFKGAALTVIHNMPDNPLAQNYRRLVEEERMDPALARLTLARQIAALVLAMWKRQEVYDPARYRIPKKA